MFKHAAATAALFVSALSNAQEATQPAAQPAAKVEALSALVQEETTVAASASDFCSLDSGLTLPAYTGVVLVRTVKCSSRYGATFNKEFVEVLFAGRPYLVPRSALFLRDETAQRFDALTSEQVEANREAWSVASLELRKVQLERAIKSLDATAKYGVALVKASIYDVSEYTEGTGFKATVYNPTKKTIKYVTFTVTGLNAVGDPVRGLRAAAPVLRGIGPIAPGETASYSKDYMWMTDIVEKFKLNSIRVEYTDGTSKVVNETKSVAINAKDFAPLTVDAE
jgi:hypothetical protein